MSTTINAAENPAMANQLLEEVNKLVTQEVVGAIPEVVLPSLPETEVKLPAGFLDPLKGSCTQPLRLESLQGPMKRQS